ncbi:MAG: hypothetical protein KDD43_01780 [Bdellovibrionales bacterium]|nr:hypothetical protein [Bdellovibrionales bacterium]
MKNIFAAIGVMMALGFVFAEAQAETMFDLVKDYYRTAREIPEVTDFDFPGQPKERLCIEIKEFRPDEFTYTRLNKFQKTYAARGPLFPERKVTKAIFGRNADIRQFEAVTNDVNVRDYVITHNLSENHTVTAYVRKKDDTLVAKVVEVIEREEEDDDRETYYSYCYPSQDEAAQ